MNLIIDKDMIHYYRIFSHKGEYFLGNGFKYLKPGPGEEKQRERKLEMNDQNVGEGIFF